MRKLSIYLKLNLKHLKTSKYEADQKRYNYPFQGKIAEVDIWLEDLKGLVIVEFEFINISAFDGFKMPEFCLRDITGLEWLAGGKLSGKKYSDIKDKLEKLGYNPIYE